MNRAERRRAASMQRAKAKTHRWWLRKEAAKAATVTWTDEEMRASLDTPEFWGRVQDGLCRDVTAVGEAQGLMAPGSLDKLKEQQRQDAKTRVVLP